MDRRILLAIVAIVVIGVMFFLIQSRTSHHSAQHRVFELRVVHGTSMTPSELTATQGDTVTLQVGSDSKFELHLHGYNRKLEMAPGKMSSLTLKVNISGSFEMENEGTSHHLGTLTVNPG